MNNATAIKTVILNALFNNGQETRSTFAAIKLHVLKAEIDATHADVEKQLEALVANGALVKTKNSNDWDAWELSTAARKNLSIFLEPAQELAAPPAEIIIDDASVERRINREKNMNNAIAITLKQNSDEEVNATFAEMRSVMPKSQLLADVMTAAMTGADFYFEDDALEGEDIGNGTGYYDGLCHAVFYFNGEAVTQMGTSIRYLDNKTQRCCYIVVMSKGKNVIVHDRYKRTGDDSQMVLVLTDGSLSVRNIIGMSPAWSQNATDVVSAANFFGLELDRSVPGQVYAPYNRPENLFVRMASLQRRLSK